MSVLIIALTVAASSGANAAERRSTGERRELQAFARCTVKREQALVAKALIEDWSMATMINREVITAGCASLGIASPIAVIKAALGEALVVRENVRVASAALTTVPALLRRGPDFESASNGRSPPPPQKSDPKGAIEKYQAGIMLSKLGECVVRIDADNARALFDTKIGTDAELMGTRQLAPMLSRCLPVDSTLTLNAGTIRSAVGLAYYRLAKATQGVVWQGEVR